MIKRSHQYRRRVSDPKTQSRHYRRPRHAIQRTAEKANASLLAFCEQHGKADVAMADHCWSMGRVTADTGACPVSPEHHYPTMSPQASRDLQFGEALKKDAILGFWVLNGQLDLAIDMLRGQGFKVKTLVIWHKIRSLGGNAYLPASGPVRNCSEILIIAARGRGLPINRDADKFPSVMTIERTEHSAKPAIFRQMLARLYPRTWADRPTVKLELFARERARGWRAWGNQAPRNVGGKRRTLRAAA